MCKHNRVINIPPAQSLHGYLLRNSTFYLGNNFDQVKGEGNAWNLLRGTSNATYATSSMHYPPLCFVFFSVFIGLAMNPHNRIREEKRREDRTLKVEQRGMLDPHYQLRPTLPLCG
ncbi:hypothetical protein KQX54_020130 [Cotesia glomerata]|uniref:Uncharacterized protein n=1 Tax=Cotesia glomerata TaxID=32391 RepID=A0AAV7ICU3_COTGL|nr:hypothetical protein KQX54_020130 [Cotesia glomerata]